jgi:hypothetical protein
MATKVLREVFTTELAGMIQFYQLSFSFGLFMVTLVPLEFVASNLFVTIFTDDSGTFEPIKEFYGGV